jgi:magnesium transporter
VLLLGYGVVRFQDTPMIGGSVGLSVLAAMAGASVLGAGIPVALSRVEIDPAIATGPIVTTIIDIVGIIIYFNVARVLLGI